MKDFADVIALWPNRSAVATDLDVDYGLVKQWERRRSIPARYWPRLIEAARRRGLRSVTTDTLAQLAATKRKAA